MKRILSTILAMIIALSCASFTAFAESDIRIVIDGEYKTFDVMPVIENSRTLVPMRGIFETLGAVVNWDEDTRTVMAAKGETVVMLQIDNKTAWVNGEAKELDAAAKLLEDRTMVPIRFVAEALGCKVEWDEAQRRVFVYSENDHQKGFEALNGKKVIVIGNSHTYYGRPVISVSNKKYTLADRVNNKGGIYQLCKANGIDVSVTNWCFGSHGLSQLFGGEPCNLEGGCKGVVHKDYLTDNNYDYVIVQPGVGTNSIKNLQNDFDTIISFFKEGNPDTKFILLSPPTQYGYNATGYPYPDMLSQYDEIEKKGVQILEWGKIVDYAIRHGVPGTDTVFNKNSFAVKDGYHPNLLAGYVLNVMIYCTITGEKAVDQPYGFYLDQALAPDFDLKGFNDFYYADGESDTNSDEILKSEKDMNAIAAFIDSYMDGTYKEPEKVSAKEILDGKRILFIGNSFIYYGRTVASVGKSDLSIEGRTDTKGAFYQLCKANGIDVEVINMTFGAHTLGDIMSDACPRTNDKCYGKNHMENLTDKKFDYVVFSPASGDKQAAAFEEDCDKLMSIFREANPDVKFVCLGNIGAYGFNSYKRDFPGISTYYKALEKKGVTIADWGGLVKAILDKKFTDSRFTQEYTNTTFVNTKDNYHPNLLAGYLTTLFTYCAITGESAQGQPYGFYKDETLAPVIDIPGYTEFYYNGGDADTNYPEVFESASDMAALQTLVDRYIRAGLFRNLEYTNPSAEKKAQEDLIAQGTGPMNGKKAIFIGDSNVYYGRAVEARSKKNELSERQNDKGIFYHICKANGSEPLITNWAYGSHGWWALFDGHQCTTNNTCKGIDHEAQLTDRNYDYVFLGLTRSATDEEKLDYYMQHITKLFREANPNVQIIVLAPTMIYGINDTGVVRQGTIDALKTMEEKYNVKVCDWGRIVRDILDGTVKVPGTTQEWVKNTFVVKDAKHVNLLGGYMTALMAYCVATGEKAEGQNYDFFKDTSLAPIIDVPGYVDYYYQNGDADSNFPEILASETEMRGIQQLIDKYIAEKPYKN